MGKKTKKTRKKAKTTKKKVKTTLKTNKSKALPNKPKRKANKEEKKQKPTNKAAWIGLVGTLLAAIIGAAAVFKPEKRITKLATPDYCLELSSPLILADARLTDSRCFKAPKIKVVATSINPLEDDAICAKIGKPRLHENALPPVLSENIKVNQEFGGRRLVAILNSKPFIRKQYQSTPHGLYLAEFEVSDPCSKPDRASSKIEFNYVYKEDFKEPHKVLVSNKRDYGNIAGFDGGLEIRNWSKTGQFVSADLNQEFDFKTDFYVSGFFTVEFENDLDPSGFDIALCDRWGEQLSIVFADGHIGAFSIKERGEKRSSDKVLVRSSRTTIGRTTEENTVYNYFKIKIWQYEGQSRCCLYVQRSGPVFRHDSCVHERVIDTSKLSGKCTRIKLKLWKAGILKLYNFEVAEVPRK